MSKLSNKKIIISLISIALLVVVGVAASMISYSIATKGNGDSDGQDIEENVITDGPLVSLGASGTYVTNIDLIIKSANDATDPQKFNIVEIFPNGATDDGLSNYITDEGFSKYVLTANKSASNTQSMPAGMISYNKITLSSSTALTDAAAAGSSKTIQDVLDDADLIYINSPGYDSFNGNNNMSEDLYNYLHYYALGKNKPLILDYVVKGQQAAADKTYKDFMTAVKRNYVSYRTYPWSSGVTAENFFKGIGSYYLPYNVNNASAKLSGKVLVLAGTDSPGSDSIYSKMNAYKDTLKTAAFYGSASKKPDSITFTIKNVNSASEADIIAELNNTDYNFVVIESDTSSKTMTKTLYKKLQQVSEASRYMIFDETAIGSGTSEAESSANNYLKLMNLLVTSTGVSRYSNVLAVANGFFGNLDSLGADGKAGAKQVADIINRGVYRNAGKDGGASRKYRVLEIEPCYPIDLDRAKANTTTTTKYGQAGITGGYYTVPDQVMYGVSEDEIDDKSEYYAFELSLAKVAHFTGLSADQIQIDYVSVNELISDKPVLSENYDLIYIGGDASALLPATAVNYAGTDFTWQTDILAKALSSMTSYDMYTHTGMFCNYETMWNFYRVSGGTNSVTTNGYDINTIKLQELKDYVDAGLPIIIDREVTEAFENSYQYDPNNTKSTDKNRLKQLGLHDIDPDCNMYKFLVYAYGKKASAANIGWAAIYSPTKDLKVVESVSGNNWTGRDVTAENKTARAAELTKVSNADGKYGNTIHTTTDVDASGDPIGLYATVYKEKSPTYGEDTGEMAIKKAIAAGAERPKLSITDYPEEYEEGNKSTTNVTSTVSFTVSSDVQCNFELYVDANGDGMYEEGEQKATASGTSGVLSYDLDADFFGLVNWKILAKSAANGKLCDAMSGSAFFKPESDMKKTVRILQIMPIDKSKVSSGKLEDGQIADGHSLYFCTECQQSAKRIVNNVTVNSNDHDKVLGVNSSSDISSTFGITLGKHEHDFGIVVYDSTTNKDDWERNFADELTHGYDPSKANPTEQDWTTEFGDFEFELDIVSVDEFDKYCSDAAKLSDTDASDNQKMAQSLKAQVTDILDGVKNDSYAADGQQFKVYQAELEKEIYAAIGGITSSGCNYADVIKKGIGTATAPGQWMRDKQYYKLWEYLNDGCNNGKGGLIPDKLKDAYNNYITEYDKVVTLKEQAVDYMHKSGVGYKWMANSYDIVVLGLADNFAYRDLAQLSCDQLKEYTENGGSILNSHDALNALGASSSQKLTATLRETFGMDRFHVTVSDASMGVNLKAATASTDTATFSIPTTAETTFGIGVYDWNMYDVTVKDRNVKLVFNGMTDQYYHLDKPEEGTITLEDDGPASNGVVKITIDTTNANIAGNNLTVWHKYKVWRSDWGSYENKTEQVGTITMASNSGEYIASLDIDPDNSKEYTSFNISNQDVDVVLDDAAGTATPTYKTPAHTLLSDDLTINVTAAAGANLTLKTGSGGEYTATAGADGKATFTVPQGSTEVTTDITLGTTNMLIDWDIATNTATSTNGFAVTDGKYTVKVEPKANGTALADGEVITAKFRGSETTAAITGGVAEFTFDASNTDTNDISSLLSTPTTSSPYRKYNTADSSKYFWTERLMADPQTDAEYAKVINNAGIGGQWGMIHYNAPVGISDLIATGQSTERPTANYRYAMTAAESYAHDSNVNGVTFEAKYGTRKASRVNKGGVTMYPFAISSDLLISPTHCQGFALDIEDPHVAVWYTLGANFVSTNPGTTAEFARYDSSFYAASPRDGMNSYFLYSKENVFYTGAGHQLVTGSLKDNNDERRLFINVLVNSVTKGKSKPQLKLYNICDEDDGNCDDNYVDPDDTSGNADLRKSVDTLFYDENDFVYMYNVDDSKEKMYVQFDFKAIAGSNDISNVKVFFDLDYTDLQTNEYTADSNHVMIEEYKTNISGKRERLRTSDLGDKLLLKPEYFTPYNNSYTYIVIRVQDKGGTVKTARIKVNIIPHLFDLTDATIDDNSLLNSSSLDITDKKKFNI